MNDAGNPADRPGMRYVVCLRCATRVRVERNGSSVNLSYNVPAWQKSNCCCVHLESPVHCCSFLDLMNIIDDLLPPK